MSDSSFLEAISAGYGFDGPSIGFGAAMQGEETLPGAQVRVPLAMMNRHGLVAFNTILRSILRGITGRR